MWHLAGLLAGLAVLLFVLRAVLSDLPAVLAYDWRFRPGLLALSSLLLLIESPVYALALKVLVDNSALKLPLRTIYKALFLAQMGKYLPGKIWSVVGVAVLLKRRGGNAGRAAGAQVALALIMSLCGLLYWGLAAILCGQRFEALALIAVGVLGIAALALPLRVLLERMANALLARMGRDPILLEIDALTVLRSAGLSFVVWVLSGTSFWLLILSLIKVDPGQYAYIVRAFAASQLIGFWALIVPGGLGVREGTMTAFLAGLLGSSLAAALSIAARLWSLVGDLMTFSLALLLPEARNGARDNGP
ncbi:MAG: hypothetical protein P9M14_15050 [Candidatus Alcyoniella australis]|nr:hypothetical protein [Candidatus Alcyoniella australis]